MVKKFNREPIDSLGIAKLIYKKLEGTIDFHTIRDSIFYINRYIFEHLERHRHLTVNNFGSFIVKKVNRKYRPRLYYIGWKYGMGKITPRNHGEWKFIPSSAFKKLIYLKFSTIKGAGRKVKKK
jgi:hypothetical protein